MVLCTSDETAFPCDLQRWTGLPWLLSVLGTLTRGTEPVQINWSWGRDCLQRPFTCCAEDGGGASSYNLLSPPLKSILSHPVLQRNWNFPLVFQIFCSRCSSHSAPLPRYGQMKPVRVCTHCYMFHVTPFYSDRAGIWHTELLVCLLESYTDWYIWPKTETWKRDPVRARRLWHPLL